MTRPSLYRVDIGEDCYVGTAEEVVAFMMKAEGAPEGDVATYMQGIAQRVVEALGRGPIDTDDPASFLESLARHKIARVSVGAAPTDETANPEDLLREGPVAFGPDVDPRDFGF